MRPWPSCETIAYGPSVEPFTRDIGGPDHSAVAYGTATHMPRSGVRTPRDDLARWTGA